ncbi:hypothetical protein AQ505_09095 [Pedobacter sp. PACM 27299]|uniref:sigma factor-like helix-turn-helix DNA-binding protein n=1 Tax=Pedobacter sp. PACM 27299 TaxID=1727164 RepID=UPI000706B72F|nr:sigma factor-like helix-turn-helix DNA-binding protein [Pedobacter sp. PACM 27299]ALL05633.1 hypothetical protein AQ505_09095 [Pedobacter sp. PACM 27299]
MREVFELSRKHNLSRKEIASQLNLSEKIVKNQINNVKISKSSDGQVIYSSVPAGNMPKNLKLP